MGKRTILLSSFAIAALALAACSTATRGPTTAGPAHAPVYKVGDPYQINGVWYYPAEDWSYDETGIASWYGEDFHGKYTANGEVFDLNATTGAHRTLPLPSVVQVTNLENGRSIQVRVNDRGPFARGRIMDLSRRAAQLLGFEGKGTAKVRVRILVPESIQAASLAGRAGPGLELAANQPKAAPVEKVAAESLPAPPGVTVASAQPSLGATGAISSLPPREIVMDAPALSDKVTTVPVKPTQIFIQAGAFASMDRAWRLKVQLDNFGNVSITDAKVSGTIVYRVRLGPVPTVEQADALLDKVGTASPEARIVVN
jgi:peptidoglycan lytic transglycosylase